MAANAGDGLAAPEGIHFQAPQTHLFANLWELREAVNQEHPPEAVKARILNLDSLETGRTKALLDQVLEDNVKLTIDSCKRLGQDPDYIFVHHEFLRMMGLLQDLQPLCDCEQECRGRSRPMKLIARGTEYGTYNKIVAEKRAARAQMLEVSEAAREAREAQEQGLRLMARARVYTDPGGPRRSARQHRVAQARADRLLARANEAISRAGVYPPFVGVPSRDVTRRPGKKKKFNDPERRKTNLMWRCYACRKTLSTAHNSFLSKRKILQEFLPLVHQFLKGKKAKDVIDEYHLSPTTVTEVLDTFRTVATYVVTGPLHPECRRGEPHFQMGGPGWVVEVDEAKFGKWKYYRGRWPAGHQRGWTIGAVMRNGGPEDGRDEEDEEDEANGEEDLDPNSPLIILRPIFHLPRNYVTISDFVIKWIRPGTHIMTDEARVYPRLQEFGYQVSQVNHSNGEFVRDPDDDGDDIIHTNGIEGTFKHVRDEALPPCGIKGDDEKYHLRFGTFSYLRLLKAHHKWKRKDPVKIFLHHIVRWHEDGRPGDCVDLL